MVFLYWTYLVAKMGFHYGCLIFIFGLHLQVALCGIGHEPHGDHTGNSDDSLPTHDQKESIHWPFTTEGFKKRIQSPIDIILSKVKDIKSVPGLENLNNLKISMPSIPEKKADVFNTGETVKVKVMETDRAKIPYMEFGPLPKKFFLEQMHFHWGKYDDWGSEHMIDGEVFAVEIHMVHYNEGYKNVAEALHHPDGLAVLTIFAQRADEKNALLEPLDKMIQTLTKPDEHHYMIWDQAVQWANSGINLNTEYYTYPGSLTTDPYYENVAFIILPKPITISHNQLTDFRALYHEEGSSPIVENKRRVQPLNGRPIFKGVFDK